jgi:hypothetical protein
MALPEYDYFQTFQKSSTYRNTYAAGIFNNQRINRNVSFMHTVQKMY